MQQVLALKMLRSNVAQLQPMYEHKNPVLLENKIIENCFVLLAHSKMNMELGMGNKCRSAVLFIKIQNDIHVILTDRLGLLLGAG